MSTIRRVDFIALSGITREAFDTRARRQHFHFLNTDMISETPVVGRRAYKVGDAFLTIIADNFAEMGVPLRDACTAMVNMDTLLAARWKDIGHSVREWRSGAKPVVAALVQTSIGWAIRDPIVGFFDEINSHLPTVADGLEPYKGVVIVNVSMAGALLQDRATAQEIDILEFWNSPAL
ncbi:MAG: hypothetical protein ROR55_03385 [Devosia sp.]